MVGDCRTSPCNGGRNVLAISRKLYETKSLSQSPNIENEIRQQKLNSGEEEVAAGGSN